MRMLDEVERSRSNAVKKALKREGSAAASERALSHQAKAASGKCSAADRSAAAKKAAKTEGSVGRSLAAKKAAHTRVEHAS
jgi:hypothetical protein